MTAPTPEAKKCTYNHESTICLKGRVVGGGMEMKVVLVVAAVRIAAEMTFSFFALVCYLFFGHQLLELRVI